MVKLIEKFPDETSLVDMEEVVNNEDDYKKYITAEDEDEVVINRDITENEKETIQDILDKLLE